MAIMIFGIAATGFTVALGKTAQLASLAEHEIKITRLLENALIATLSLPTLQEGTTSQMVDEMKEVSMETDTEVKLMQDLQNQDGQPLAEMYSITVTARWFEGGQERDRTATTWRYGRLYQP